MKLILVVTLAATLTACGGSGSSGQTESPLAIVADDVQPAEQITSISQPVAQPTPTQPVAQPIAGICVDTPPTNDGFGWNGVASCRLPIVPEPIVVPEPVIAPEPVVVPEPVIAPEPVIVPEPVALPLSTALRQLVSYTCSVDNDTTNTWTWNLNNQGGISDQEGTSTGSWRWDTESILNINPVGPRTEADVTATVIDGGLLLSTDNSSSWGSCVGDVALPPQAFLNVVDHPTLQCDLFGRLALFVFAPNGALVSQYGVPLSQWSDNNDGTITVDGNIFDGSLETRLTAENMGRSNPGCYRI